MIRGLDWSAHVPETVTIQMPEPLFSSEVECSARISPPNGSGPRNVPKQATQTVKKTRWLSNSMRLSDLAGPWSEQSFLWFDL